MNKLIDSDAVYIYEHNGHETFVLFSDTLAVAWYNTTNKPTTEDEVCLKNI